MPEKNHIRSMFDSIAGDYDSLNHILSLGIDRIWRRKAVSEVMKAAPMRILDVACGTGDLAIALAAKAPDGLERAQAPWRAAQEIFDALIAEGACCDLSDLAVNGGDMAALGFRGRAIGAALQKLLREVAEEKLPNEKPALLRRAQRLYRSGFGTQAASVTKNLAES